MFVVAAACAGAACAAYAAVIIVIFIIIVTIIIIYFYFFIVVVVDVVVLVVVVAFFLSCILFSFVFVNCYDYSILSIWILPTCVPSCAALYLISGCGCRKTIQECRRSVRPILPHPPRTGNILKMKTK